MGNQEKEVVTIQKAVDLLQALYGVQELEGLKFATKVAINMSNIEERLKPLDETMKPSKEFETFAKIIQEVQGDQEKIKELESQNVELVEERKKQISVIEAMLKDHIEIELIKIPSNILPDKINAQQIKGLKLLIV
tara:strand:- start:2643 stop:3050 length:408 start_codon:yes stop_codon:yes gene_type:complete